MTKQIIIEHLRTGDKKYEYSEWAERLIQEIVANSFGLDIGHQTTGFNSDYDFKLNNTTIELKISGYDDLQIEYARDNDEPSGISVAKARVYMTLTPGWSTYGGSFKHVGKLRIFKTYQLRECIQPLQDQEEHTITYPPHDGGRGSKCVKLTKEILKTYNIDIALFDIGLIKEYNKVTGFDMDILKACGDFNYVKFKVGKLLK